MASPRFHINHKINLGFGLTLALLVAISVNSYRSMTSLGETVQWEVHTHEVLNQLDDLFLQIQNAETGQRGYLLTGEACYLEPYDTALARIHEELAKLRRLSADNPRQQQRLDVLEPLIAKKLDELNETIELRKHRGVEAALRLVRTGRGQQLMDEIRGLLETMEAEEDELLHQRDQDAAKSTRRAISIILFLTVLNMAFVFVVVVAIHRDIDSRTQAEVAIRKAHDELEARVRERTAELAATNEGTGGASDSFCFFP